MNSGRLLHNFGKFFFVGVMIAATFFANGEMGKGQSAIIARESGEGGRRGTPAPMVILSAPVTELTAAPLVRVETSAPDIVPVELSLPLGTSLLALPSAVLESEGAGVFLSSSLPASDGGSVAEPWQDLLPRPAAPASFLLRSFPGPEEGGFSRTGDVPPPELYARAAALFDLASGARFFARNTDRRWPTASLTKLMTAAVVLPRLDAKQQITLSAIDFSLDSPEKSLNPGDRYRAGDLLRIMLVASSNEAAEAFADSYGRANFIALMNGNAREWSMQDTHYDDPSGLSVSNQSTADDLAKLVVKIADDFPDIFAITRAKDYRATEIGSGRRRTFENTNLFAGEPEFLGGKTGYTDEASGNLVSLFRYGGRTIAVIVLGSPDRFGETSNLLRWFEANYAVGAQ